ncbi:MAG TPA: hypothetical protein P5572_08320, partial [Phycisphaerae bacterium]|nr:hypothetical protein [Phycisphaerae bacterium]
FFVLLTVGAFGPAISSHGWVVRLAALPVLACGVLAIVLLFDRADLVDRTGMRCHRCGYDLRGQSETRCSECGAAFDPSEAARRAAAAEYQAAATRRRRVASAVLVAITVLGILVFLGNVLWWRAARRVPAAAPTATATPQTP